MRWIDFPLSTVKKVVLALYLVDFRRPVGTAPIRVWIAPALRIVVKIDLSFPLPVYQIVGRVSDKSLIGPCACAVHIVLTFCMQNKRIAKLNR